ncbi:MAG TPA: transcriptional regulator [Myxococcales bacterium]|nr:transcriptional regulator [Deltaproteobacteria bacterium]HAA59242.1 transcriptional regulator [Myxococcales bacterium]|tara:strand:+ start:22439 stop:22930 length:492 start_codon:yes stop_codon:yes gene_type:complete
MKLSTRAEYGIRALIELAVHYDKQRPLMLQVIAERQNISKKYLEQLFIPLRKAGVVEGVRGPSGGYRLARPPAEIRLDEIVSTLEGSLSVADCLDDGGSCEKSGSCATQEVWARVTAAIEEVLGSISLEELISRHSCMMEQIRILSALDSLSSSVETGPVSDS